MTNDALINGKTVLLSDTERKAGEAFHRGRLAFAFVNGKLVLNENENDDRDHQHWLMEDYGLTVEQFEDTARGYIKKGRIQFFIGSSFGPLDMNEVTIDAMCALCVAHYRRYPNTGEVKVFNGVHVGKIGELWPPIQHVTTYTVE